MKRLALAFALGIAAVLLMLPSGASAWSRGHGVVVARPGVVVVGPHVPVPVVRPFPRPVFVAPRVVIVPAPVPFFAVAPRPCARWWWDGWRWVWVRGC